MKAEIIATGTELLLGEILDTNAQFLANQLALLGIDLYFISTVGDNYERLSAALRQAWQRSELILTTGGLGPTQGDITREVIAGLLGEKLYVDQALKQGLVSFFTQRGIQMSPNNLKQATLIPSSTAILNPLGTAPGWWVERDGRVIVAMPGPPGEMRHMWQNAILPRLKDKTGGIILSRVIKTFGVAESTVDELLSPLLSSANSTLATYAKQDGINLRITAKSAQKEQAQEMISKREAEIKAIMGDSIWGSDDDKMEEVAGQLLIARALSLAVAESFTGGLLTYTLSNTAQSLLFFKGGVVVRSDEARGVLGLEPDVARVPAEDLAKDMAEMVRRQFIADIGISVEGSSESTDAGAMSMIFIAIDNRETKETQVRSYTGRLSQMRSRAVYHALFNLIKLLGAA